MASKNENTDSIYLVLEPTLFDVTKSKDKFLFAARRYVDSVAGRDTALEGINPQGHSK